MYSFHVDLKPCEPHTPAGSDIQQNLALTSRVPSKKAIFCNINSAEFYSSAFLMRCPSLKSCYLFIPCTMDSHETLMIPPQKLGHCCIWRRCGRSQPNESKNALQTCMHHDLGFPCTCLLSFSLISGEASSKTPQSDAKVLGVMASLRSEAAVSPPTPSVLPSSICLDLLLPLLLLKNSAHIFFLERLHRWRGAPRWRRGKE